MRFSELEELSDICKCFMKNCSEKGRSYFCHSSGKQRISSLLGLRLFYVSTFLICCVLLLGVLLKVRRRDAVVLETSQRIGNRSTSYSNALTQDDLDYFAKNIQLNFSVVENSFFNKKLFESEIVLTNKGDKPFMPHGWEIIFSQPALVEPSSYPYPDGLEKSNYGVKFHFLMGNVYKMAPTKGFGTLKPGRHKIVRYISEHNNVAVTDVHPNWYFAGPALQPRVIENTKGDSLDFVAPYKTPAMWKRNTILDDPDYDIMNPFSAAQRYKVHGVEDLGAAPHLVIPTPVSIQTYNKQSTVNVLTNSWVILAAPRLANEGKYLSDIWKMNMVLKAQDSHYVQLVEEKIELTVRGKSLPTDESYELRVSPTNNIITIKASQPAGSFYAIQTLLSLIDKDGNIPETVIRDGPRFRYRGLLLDVARNFQSKEKVLRYLDIMAMYKLNKFHFHLTDDEGWRLAIPGLEELTEVGASRCHDLTETKCLLPFLGSGPFKGPPGSGYYTVEDYRDILRYATDRHIEVIPEIDMPGHSHAAIKAMLARYKKLEALNVTEATRYLLNDLQDESVYLSVQSFADDAMNPCLRSTYTFISRIINALYSMHKDISPLRMFNFGGDEVPSGTWQKSPVCERLNLGGLKTDLKTYMVTQVANMTALYNLDLAAWEDGLMLEGKPMKRDTFPNKNIYVFAWNNVWEWGTHKRAYEFANNGYKVILTPATNLYLDHPYEPDPNESGLYWATRYSDTKKVFSTMPGNLYMNADTYRSGREIQICQSENREEECPPLEKPENIEGIQGSLFSELLRSQWITDYMLLPKMLALAERAWHEAYWEQETDRQKIADGMNEDWVKFANTLGHKELARLDKLGYKYRIPPPGAIVEDNVLKTAAAFPGLGVEFSDDGGKTWKWAISGETIIEPGKYYLLRTRSPFGTRYSRQVSLFEDYSTSRASTLMSFLSLVVGVCFTSLMNLLIDFC